MRRREFIGMLGSAGLAWPLAASAQQNAPVVGFLHSGSAGPNAHLVAAFLRGLQETGFRDQHDVFVEYRWAEGKYERLQQLASELVSHHVAVLYTAGGSVAAIEARKVSENIPLVFVMGSDPVRAGLVTSLPRPSGNSTGVTLITSGLEAKRVELLRQLAPSADVIAAVVNPDNPNASDITADVQTAGKSLGVSIHFLQAATDAQLDAALATLPQLKAGGILVANDPFYVSRREKIIAAIAEKALPAVYQSREFPAAGGLVSYGSNLADMYRKSGVYVGRILKGEKPADLPVQQPTTLELIFNLRTARTLKLTIPQTLLST
jgi:putative ABC transport system substrate-binding protein